MLHITEEQINTTERLQDLNKRSKIRKEVILNIIIRIIQRPRFL